MVRNRVIPCLLLRGRGLVKTVKFKDTTYLGDPVNVVKIFNEKEVDELFLLDITATLENRAPNFNLISEITSECFMPLAYGGGIRDVEVARELFHLGIEKIVINTAAIENPGLIGTLASQFGCQSIVVSIDVRKGFWNRQRVVTHCGKRETGIDPVAFAKESERLGAGEILLNSIDRDGTMSGYDVDLIRAVTASTAIPVVASGGAGRIEHFSEAIRKGGCSAVAAGSLFVFHGKHRAVLISYPSQRELQALNI